MSGPNIDFTVTKREFEKQLIRDYRESCDEQYNRIQLWNSWLENDSELELDQIKSMGPNSLPHFCQKSCLLYTPGDQPLYRRSRVFVPTWNEWFDALGDRKFCLEGGRFFAKPVPFPSGVQLNELPGYHQKLLHAITQRMELIKQDTENYSPPKFLQEFQIDPLCYSVIAVLEETKTEDSEYNMLLILTGDNSRLGQFSFPGLQLQGELKYPIFHRVSLKEGVRLVAKWHTMQPPVGLETRDFFADGEYMTRVSAEIERVGFHRALAWGTLYFMIARKLGLMVPPAPHILRPDELRVCYDWDKFEPDETLLTQTDELLDVPEELRKTIERHIQALRQVRAEQQRKKESVKAMGNE